MSTPVSLGVGQVSMDVTARFSATVVDAPDLWAGVFRLRPHRIEVVLSRPLGLSAPWRYVVHVLGRVVRLDGRSGELMMRTFTGMAESPGADLPVWAARFVQRCMPVEPVTEFLSTVESGQVVTLG